MSPLLALLLLQGSGWIVSPAAPTVGDTVTITRRIPAEATAAVRLDPLTATESVQPLAAPRWSYAEGAVTVAYRFAVFASGPQRVSVPPVDVTYADGSSVTVPATVVVIPVATVLPDVAPSRIRPQASMGPLARSATRLAPAVLVPAAVALGLALLVLWRRRRSPRPAMPDVLDAEVVVPLEEWIAAGESRAVATVVTLKLRRIIAAMVPNASPHEDTDAYAAVILREERSAEADALVAALRALERARFSPAAPADIHEVIDEAERAVRAFEAARTETA